MWVCGCLDPADGALFLLSEIRVRVACGSLLRQGYVRRLRWNAELRIGPFRFEILGDRNERRQRGQFRLSISDGKQLLTVSHHHGLRMEQTITHEGPVPPATNEKT
jgi:hypothetical protein